MRPTLKIDITNLTVVKERKSLILKVLDNRSDYPEVTDAQIKDLALEYIEITRQQQVEYSRRSNKGKLKGPNKKAKVDVTVLFSSTGSTKFSVKD